MSRTDELITRECASTMTRDTVSAVPLTQIPALQRGERCGRR
jgi:hypothetical protein